MDQFYNFLNDPNNRPDFNRPLAMLNQGYGTANSQVNDLFNNSLGQTEFFKTPLQNQQDQGAAHREARKQQLEQDIYNARRAGYSSPGTHVMQLYGSM